jgi:hypothetical protein
MRVVYDFAPIIWKKDKDGLATFTIKFQNDDSLEDFIENAYETDEETYSNSFGWIMIKATNNKTKAKKEYKRGERITIFEKSEGSILQHLKNCNVLV